MAIVMDAYDVEALRICASNPQFDLLSCVFERSLQGDVVLDFHDFLIDFANNNKISLKSDSVMDSTFDAIFNRISERFFERPVVEDARSGASGIAARRLAQSGCAAVHQGHGRHAGEPEFLHYSARHSLDGHARMEERLERAADLAAGNTSEPHARSSSGCQASFRGSGAANPPPAASH